MKAPLSLHPTPFKLKLTLPPRVAQTPPRGMEVAMEQVVVEVASVAAALAAKCGPCRRSSSKDPASTMGAHIASEIKP